ncbi:succinylglutamate desuccinylase [Alteromonas sp. C1M14]|uniref:succinylglutamate desuccinylase n=1 Tax=Alteromonas sp. C1M14 TaxID=2841567 RepID=UPI001C0925FC|nr:succinylglutamate desuccinylase [Alteromonas sp. C1M14]MBU2978896.1 succinylglutamate desuccinylase [Alteromonas sp. C1M14]
MRSRLLAYGDFLNLSRFSPDNVTADEFILPSGVKVKVVGPGIIHFYPPDVSQRHQFIVLSSGIHGNETAPIEICDDLVKQILLGGFIPAHPVMFLFGNLDAMAIAERFVEENMNRLFGAPYSADAPTQNKEQQRAKELKKAVADFFDNAPAQAERLHYDLHTAIRESKNEKFAVYPYLHGKSYSGRQLAILKACGVQTVLLSASPTTTFSYYSSYYYQAHGFTVELGKVQAFGQNDMANFAEVRDTLKQLISQRTLAVDDDISDVTLYKINQVINKNCEDFALHFADDIPNFTDFPKGFCLASETGARYEAQRDGEAIVFPNANVALGQRALLTVLPVQVGDIDVQS